MWWRIFTQNCSDALADTGWTVLFTGRGTGGAVLRENGIVLPRAFSGDSGGIWRSLNSIQRPLNEIRKALNDVQRALNGTQRHLNDSQRPLNGIQTALNVIQRHLSDVQSLPKVIQTFLNDVQMLPGNRFRQNKSLVLYVFYESEAADSGILTSTPKN